MRRKVEAVRDGVIESTDDEGTQLVSLSIHSRADSRQYYLGKFALSLNHPRRRRRKNGNAFCGAENDRRSDPQIRVAVLHAEKALHLNWSLQPLKLWRWGCSKLSAQVFAGYAPPPIFIRKCRKCDFGEQ